MGEDVGVERSSESGRYEVGTVVRRFISIPMKVKGAQEVSAQELSPRRISGSCSKVGTSPKKR